MSERIKYPTETFQWHGITVSVTYETNCFSIENLCHFDIQAVAPTDAQLPITETGYRSHFTGADSVAEFGGPVAFVRAWLDDAAQSAKWKAVEATSRQLNLF